MIWMPNKAFKSGMTPDAYYVKNLKPWNTTYMHVQSTHPRYGRSLDMLFTSLTTGVNLFHQ
jgi:hypothetical protein